MKKYIYIVVVLFEFVFLSSCTDLVGTFEDFQGDGEIIYVGKIDSLKVHEGLHKIQLEGYLYYAETAEEVIVKWNDQQYSQSLEGYEKTDTLKILLDNLEEDLYVFDIYTVDKKQNRSIITTIQANVYGDKFIAAQNPVTYTYTLNEDGSVTFTWNEISKLMKVSLDYVDVSGKEKAIVVPFSTITTEIPDIQMANGVKITTWIKPNEDALEYISLPAKYEDLK